MIISKAAIRLPIVPYFLAVLMHISIYQIVITSGRCCYNLYFVTISRIHAIWVH